ncbi:hypothetical protein DFH94DRAFT_771249 [Russula ochroleuca]|jgi:hypothetical protein|uniref:Uncharacterized protein n=1 Tax=Russula ochroleuca TaxID=152965 RepID=A0A9P5MPT5_9AGAM|nr:hypothetical protein DFH94DRAFT_771249 [Russula ochroleuca]
MVRLWFAVISITGACLGTVLGKAIRKPVKSPTSDREKNRVAVPMTFFFATFLFANNICRTVHQSDRS